MTCGWSTNISTTDSLYMIYTNDKALTLALAPELLTMRKILLFYVNYE